MKQPPFTGKEPFIGTVKNSNPPRSSSAPIRYGSESGFKLRISDPRTGGSWWMGKAGPQNMWARVVPDENYAVKLCWDTDDNGNRLDFIKVLGDDGDDWVMTWSGGYIGNPVAFNWLVYANKWTFDQKHLITQDSGQPLSLCTNGDLWCYAHSGDEYYTLDVEQVPC